MKGRNRPDIWNLIFRAVAETRNLQKHEKYRETRQKISSNTCLYNIFDTFFSYRGYSLAISLQIYLRTSSLKRANNAAKLPGVGYVAKNWALAMMLKALPLVHFWSTLLLKEQMMTSEKRPRKTFKMLVWSPQNRPISSEICIENNHKMGRFLPIALWWSLPRKPPRNLTFSSATYQKPCVFYVEEAY